jgi:hypothetical protein
MNKKYLFLITTMILFLFAGTVSALPPASITNPQTATGNFYINNSWTNPVDADFNGTIWKYINSTRVVANQSATTTFLNLTWSPHYTQNISAQTVDTSGNMNTTKVWFNATIANNVPVQDVIGNKTVVEGQSLYINISSTDLDSDILTYAQNGSGTLNSSTGAFSWTPATPGTYYVNFSVNDSYGGLDYEVVDITVLTNFNVSTCRIISTSGNYILVNNITNTSSMNCITITAHNVELNGNNYTINGTNNIINAVYSYNNINITVKNINVINASAGIAYDNVTTGLIRNNSMFYLNDDGIDTQTGSEKIIIENNSIQGSYYCIAIFGVYNQTVRNNICDNGYTGIYVAGQNNIIASNIITNYSWQSVAIVPGSGNTSIYNNILEKTWIEGDVYFNLTKTPGINIINGSYLGGNYWINNAGTGYSQTCLNYDNDGICDSPYHWYVDGEGIDYLPLTYIVSQITKFIPNIVSSCSDSHTDTTINISCTPNNSNNITNSLNITRLNDNVWNNGSMSWTQSGLSESTQYNYRVYSYNNSGNGSLNLTYFEKNITTDATPSTNYRLSGFVVPSGSTITVTGQGSLTGGSYDFGQVFLAGYTYWVNVSHAGHTPNNSQITFGASDIIYNVTLDVIIVNASPIIVSLGNNFTNNDSLSFTVEMYENVLFNFTANQTLTGCTWTYSTQINCSGLNSYAYKNFSTAGIQTVQANGSNSNGSTQVITWIVNVNNTYPTPTPTTVTYSDMVYISKDNQVLAINTSTSTLIFRIILMNKVESTITLTGDKIVFATDKILYTANSTTGQILTKYYLNDKITFYDTTNNNLIRVI